MSPIQPQTVVAPVAPVPVTPPPAAPPMTAVPPAPAVPVAAEPRIEAPVITSADILKREVVAKPAVAPTPTPDDVKVAEELSRIADPAQRAILEKKLKDLESGYQNKYQTLAQQRREVEDIKFKLSNWTPQRLAEEMRKPEFVQSMQALQQTAPPTTFEGTPDEWSALSDTEKKHITKLEQDQRSLQQQILNMRQKEEDVETKKLYPDYEPQVVDEAIEGLRTGQITASRVDIWKVINHDKNVERGYQYGYEDGYKKAVEKLNASSMTPSFSVTDSEQVPEDVQKGGFSSIAMWRLQRKKAGAQQPKR